MAHVRKKGKGQRLGIVEIRICDTALYDLGIILHGVVPYEKAVLVDHFIVNGIQLAHGTGLVDADGKAGGEVININGMYVPFLHGFAAKCVEDDHQVFSVHQGI